MISTFYEVLSMKRSPQQQPRDDYAPRIPTRIPDVETRRSGLPPAPSRRDPDAPPPPRDASKPTTSDVRQVLDRYFQLDATTGAQSKTGNQLEHGRLGMAPIGDAWASKNAAEDKLHTLGAIRRLWDRIDPAARVLIRLTQLPSGFQRYERICPETELLTVAEIVKRQGGLCLEGLPGGGLCKRAVVKNATTCAQHLERFPPMGKGGLTARGELFLRRATIHDFPPSRAPRNKNPRWEHDHHEGDETDPRGYVVVVGQKAIHPTYAQIAEALSPDFDDTVRRRRRGSGKSTSEAEQLVEVAVAARDLVLASGLRLEAFCAGLLGKDGAVSARRVKEVTLDALHALGATAEFGMVWERGA